MLREQWQLISDWRNLLVIAGNPVEETTCFCLMVCIGKAMNSSGLFPVTADLDPSFRNGDCFKC